MFPPLQLPWLNSLIISSQTVSLWNHLCLLLWRVILSTVPQIPQAQRYPKGIPVCFCPQTKCPWIRRFGANVCSTLKYLLTGYKAGFLPLISLPVLPAQRMKLYTPCTFPRSQHNTESHNGFFSYSENEACLTTVQYHHFWVVGIESDILFSTVLCFYKFLV